MLDKDRLNEILIELLLLDGNETNLINAKTYIDYKNLVLAVTKATKNIRYCGIKGCVCHPEYTIKKLLENVELADFINEYIKDITVDLNRWCDTYSPVISNYIYE